MAIDNRLQVFNEEGQSVDYDILASDVKFLPDGKDLPTKLAELEQEIGQGGYTPPAGGIPKSDLAQSVQDTLDDVANKVDKETGKVLIPSTDLAKLQSLPTATELTQQLGSKANDNAVVKSVSVNGGTAQTPQNGNVNIQAVKSVTINGTTTPADNNGNVNLGNVNGEDGVGFGSVSSAQDGTVVITLTNGDTMTIDLNHNHPGYLKYVLCEDMTDYISMTKDSSTLYLIPVE